MKGFYYQAKEISLNRSVRIPFLSRWVSRETSFGGKILKWSRHTRDHLTSLPSYSHGPFSASFSHFILHHSAVTWYVLSYESSVLWVHSCLTKSSRPRIISFNSFCFKIHFHFECKKQQKNVDSHPNDDKHLDGLKEKYIFFLNLSECWVVRQPSKMNPMELEAPPKRDWRQDLFHPWQSTHTEEEQLEDKQGRRHVLKCNQDHVWTNRPVWKSW